MAFAVEFQQANKTYIAPGCLDLPVCVTTDSNGVPLLISCWSLTDEERAEVARTGTVYLSIYGQAQPPVLVSPISPLDAVPETGQERNVVHLINHVMSVIQLLITPGDDMVEKGNLMTGLHEYLTGTMGLIGAQLGLRANYEASMPPQLRFKPITQADLDVLNLEKETLKRGYVSSSSN